MHLTAERENKILGSEWYNILYKLPLFLFEIGYLLFWSSSSKYTYLNEILIKTLMFIQANKKKSTTEKKYYIFCFKTQKMLLNILIDLYGITTLHEKQILNHI